MNCTINPGFTIPGRRSLTIGGKGENTESALFYPDVVEEREPEVADRIHLNTSTHGLK